VSDLATVEVLALAVAAVGVGFAKTAIGGVASSVWRCSRPCCPARESTGALLPLLLVGDVIAVTIYRRHADWPALLRLFPSVAVGVLVGVAFVARVDDTAMRRMIGRRAARAGRRAPEPAPAPRDQDPECPARGAASAVGMPPPWCSACWPVSPRWSPTPADPSCRSTCCRQAWACSGFLGTSAWFFFAVNLFKVPFSVGLDLISVESLILDLWLIPAVVVGAFLGRAVIHRIDQGRFEVLVLAFVVLSSAYLLR
jgi:uncharacterized membrane protein YfcA